MYVVLPRSTPSKAFHQVPSSGFQVTQGVELREVGRCAMFSPAALFLF